MCLGVSFRSNVHACVHNNIWVPPWKKNCSVSQRQKKHQIVDGVLCIQSTPQASDQNNSEVAVRYNDNATMERLSKSIQFPTIETIALQLVWKHLMKSDRTNTIVKIYLHGNNANGYWDGFKFRCILVLHVGHSLRNGHVLHKLTGGWTRLPKFKFSAKFPIDLHVILQIQIRKFENDCYIMWKIILTKNPSRFNVEPLLK